jgi:cytoskeletal protein RodZ
VIRSFVRRGLRLGVLVGAAWFLVQVFLRRQPSPGPADQMPSSRSEPRRPSSADPGLGAAGNGSTAALLVEPAAPADAPPRSSTTTPETTTAPPPRKVEAPAAPSQPAPTASAAKAQAKATKTAKATKATKSKPAKAKAAKTKATKKAAVADVPAWIEPVEGAAPPTHPVKAKVSSKIYHLPGMTNYDRTAPDRCYRDAEAAEADGFRKSQR